MQFRSFAMSAEMVVYVSSAATRARGEALVLQSMTRLHTAAIPTINPPGLEYAGKALHGTVGVGEKEAGPTQPGSPPSRPSVTALGGNVVVHA